MYMYVDMIVYYVTGMYYVIIVTKYSAKDGKMSGGLYAVMACTRCQFYQHSRYLPSPLIMARNG